LSRVVPLGGATPPVPQNVLHAVGEGVLAVWRDVEMRTCFAYWGLVSVLIGGTMQVALPVLAKERLHDGAAFGMLMAAHGAGMLAGMAFSSMTAKYNAGKPVRIGLLALSVDAMAGLLIMPLGLITAGWQGGLLLLSLGALVGLVQVAVFTWIQKRATADDGTRHEHLHVHHVRPGAAVVGRNRLDHAKRDFAANVLWRWRDPGGLRYACVAVHADAPHRNRCLGSRSWKQNGWKTLSRWLKRIVSAAPHSCAT
jgi:hypothetical protein